MTVYIIILALVRDSFYCISCFVSLLKIQRKSATWPHTHKLVSSHNQEMVMVMGDGHHHHHHYYYYYYYYYHYYSGRRPRVKVCRAVLFVRNAIVRPRGIGKRKHVIVWRLYHQLNTLLWFFCDPVSVLELIFKAAVVHICTSRRLIKWKLHSFCIPFDVVRRRPSLERCPLGVAQPTETTAYKAYWTRMVLLL